MASPNADDDKRTKPKPPSTPENTISPRKFFLSHSRQSSLSTPRPAGSSPSSTPNHSVGKGSEQRPSVSTPKLSSKTTPVRVVNQAGSLERAEGPSGRQTPPSPSKIPQLHSPVSAGTTRRASSSAVSAASTISDPPSPTATPPLLSGGKSAVQRHAKGPVTKMASIAQEAPEKTTPERNVPGEDSYIHVSQAPTIQLDDSKKGALPEDEKTTDAQRVSTLSQTSEKTLVDESSSNVQSGVSFADALKEHANGGDHQRQHGTRQEDDIDTRTDDSYPELDEMSINEVHRHQPPARHEPYRKIRWAPFNVPAERRLQTLTVLMHCLCIVGLVSLFFAFCANPFAWPLLLLYLLHVLSTKVHLDGSLRFRSEWFRSSYIWHLFAGYFPAHLHKTHDLPATRKYIFGYHPHGIISHGAWAAFATEALGFAEKFPGITNSLLTLDSNFRLPFYRDYILAMGVRSVSKESIVNILTRGGANNEGMGRAVTIVVGGARESLEAQPGQMRLVLKDRKGFIKIAVRTGADLVPVVAFGENDLYDQLRPKDHPLVHKIQMFVLKVWKFTLPFLHGRGIFNYDVGLMPYRHPLNIVVGAPIHVRQSSYIDDKEIDRLHGLYVEEVEKLWDRYKNEFASDRKEELQILH